MEYKSFDAKVELKADGDDGAGSITGYASTFGNWDLARERPVRGAFAPHLKQFLQDGFVAFGHQWFALPIGVPTEAEEDETGLRVSAQFHSTGPAQDARTTIKERLALRKSVKLSIGYEIIRDEFTEEGRLLKEIKLLEWSYVTYPMNPMAELVSAKNLALEGARPLGDYANAVETALLAFSRQAGDLKERRAKEGRVLSESNRKRIASLVESLSTVLADLEELLDAASPKDTAKADARKLYAQFLQTQATLNGVLHHANRA